MESPIEKLRIDILGALGFRNNALINMALRSTILTVAHAEAAGSLQQVWSLFEVPYVFSNTKPGCLYKLGGGGRLI